MTALPTLNMRDWSILDYELAVDGIRQVNDASLWLQNQPRAYNTARQDYHPGGDFIIQIGEDWCAGMLTKIVESLRAMRFPDPKHDERRVLLLLQNETRWGSASNPLAEILAMVASQMAPAPV